MTGAWLCGDSPLRVKGPCPSSSRGERTTKPANEPGFSVVTLILWTWLLSRFVDRPAPQLSASTASQKGSEELQQRVSYGYLAKRGVFGHSRESKPKRSHNMWNGLSAAHARGLTKLTQVAMNRGFSQAAAGLRQISYKPRMSPPSNMYFHTQNLFEPMWPSYSTNQPVLTALLLKPLRREVVRFPYFTGLTGALGFDRSVSQA